MLYHAKPPVFFRFSITLLLLLVLFTAADAQQRYEFESRQMGTTFQILLYAESDSVAQSVTSDAFKHIEYLNGVLSDYFEDSELSRLSDVADAGGFGKDFAADGALNTLKKAGITRVHQRRGRYFCRGPATRERRMAPMRMHLPPPSA